MSGLAKGNWAPREKEAAAWPAVGLESRQRQLLPTGQTTLAEAVGKSSKMEVAPGRGAALFPGISRLCERHTYVRGQRASLGHVFTVSSLGGNAGLNYCLNRKKIRIKIPRLYFGLLTAGICNL